MRSRAAEEPSEVGAAATTGTSVVTTASRDIDEAWVLVAQHEALRAVDGYSPVARKRCDRFKSCN